jgi:hypothetical protein
MTRDTVDKYVIELIPDQKDDVMQMNITRKLFVDTVNFVLIAGQQWNSSQIILDSGANASESYSRIMS